MKTNVLCLAFVAFLFLNCKNNSSSKPNDDSLSMNILADPADELLGEYTSEPNGKAEFRISKVNGTFIAEVWDINNWSETETIVVADEKNLNTLFGKTMVDHVEIGLISKENPFGIFKVDDDFRLAGDKPDSDYIVIYLFPLTAYKL